MLPIIPALALQAEQPKLIIPERSKLIGAPALVLPDRRKPDLAAAMLPIAAMRMRSPSSGGGGGTWTDPASWSDVAFQFEMPTTSGSQSFTDASTNGFTISKTTSLGWGPRVSTSKFAVGAESADGSLASYGSGRRLWISQNVQAMHLPGAFTIEGWVAFESLAGTQCLVARWNSTTGNRSWLVEYDTGNLELALSADGSTTITKMSYAWTPTLNTFYHWAFVFDGVNDYSLYTGVLGGGTGSRVATASGAVTLANPSTATAAFSMFSRFSSGTSADPMFGWQDETRVVKAALYSGTTYTIPTGPFRRS
jgi:hypothetical protein